MCIIQHLLNIALSSDIIHFPLYPTFHVIHGLAICTSLVVHFCVFIIHGLGIRMIKGKTLFSLPLSLARPLIIHDYSLSITSISWLCSPAA